MDQSKLNSLTSFIWNIAGYILRNVYVRGKYRDVVLPMTVLRRLHAVLSQIKSRLARLNKNVYGSIRPIPA